MLMCCYLRSHHYRVKMIFLMFRVSLVRVLFYNSRFKMKFEDNLLREMTDSYIFICKYICIYINFLLDSCFSYTN